MPKSSANAASQRDQAYRSLRRLLVLQQLQPGERLREPEWVKRLGVHRTALREAFARLDAEGLIERGPQTGYFVPLLTANDIAEITRLRFTLECLAIEEICSRSKRSLEPLKDAIKQFQQFLAGEYSLGVLEADRRFHEALVDAASMRRLSALYHRAPLPMLQHRVEDHQIWREECLRTVREHQAILGALQKGDAAQGKELLRKHLHQRSILPICR